MSEQAKNFSGRKYKDTVLRNLYLEPRRAIELFNALENKNYKPTARVKYFDIEDRLLGRYGDVFCSIEREWLVLSEHMSTFNLNIPLRMLQYLMDGITAEVLHGKNLHGEFVKIPTPRFYLLYNGRKSAKNLPKTMKLSDSFITLEKPPALEVIVNVIDIRYSSKGKILEKSPSLGGYSYVIHLIESYIKQGFTRDKAIANAINRAINEQIAIADFLEENYRGVIDMLGYEYSLEHEIEGRNSIARAEGIAEGMTKGMAEGMTKGMAEGMTKGITEGIIKGITKGKDEQALETAFYLLELGMELSTVAAAVKRPLKWVENLIAKR